MKRIAGIDYLKALAIVLVIMNHSANDALKASPLYFFVIRMAVPIFVLISGFNFAASREKLARWTQWYAPKRLATKLGTYLIPMLVVFAIWAVLKTPDLTTLVKTFILQDYGQGAYYFWIIVELYLLFPIVYKLTKNRGGGTMRTLVHFAV